MLRPLVGAWIQVLFHSPHRGAFHRSLTVLSTIGLTGVFSLTGWSRQIHAGFLVSRATQDNTNSPQFTDKGLSPATAGLSRTFSLMRQTVNVLLQPHDCTSTTMVWALPRSLATTGGIINLFSFPGGTKMFQFPPLASHKLSCDAWITPRGLSHSEIHGSKDICSSPQLIAAYHVLHRLREPRHPPCALNYFLRLASPTTTITACHEKGQKRDRRRQAHTFSCCYCSVSARLILLLKTSHSLIRAILQFACVNMSKISSRFGTPTVSRAGLTSSFLFLTKTWRITDSNR